MIKSIVQCLAPSIETGFEPKHLWFERIHLGRFGWADEIFHSKVKMVHSGVNNIFETWFLADRPVMDYSKHKNGRIDSETMLIPVLTKTLGMYPNTCLFRNGLVKGTSNKDYVTKNNTLSPIEHVHSTSNVLQYMMDDMSMHLFGSRMKNNWSFENHFGDYECEKAMSERDLIPVLNPYDTMTLLDCVSYADWFMISDCVDVGEWNAFLSLMSDTRTEIDYFPEDPLVDVISRYGEITMNDLIPFIRGDHQISSCQSRFWDSRKRKTIKDTTSWTFSYVEDYIRISMLRFQFGDLNIKIRSDSISGYIGTMTGVIDINLLMKNHPELLIEISQMYMYVYDSLRNTVPYENTDLTIYLHKDTSEIVSVEIFIGEKSTGRIIIDLFDSVRMSPAVATVFGNVPGILHPLDS